MRVSISNLAWDPREDGQVATLLDEYRIDAIDVAPGKYFPDIEAATSQDISAIRRMWADRGVEIVGMQALLFGTTGLNMFGEDEVRKRMLHRLQAICGIGAGLGTNPGVRLVFGSPKNRDRTGLSSEAAKTIAVAFFRRLAAIADEHGVTVCLEPNPPSYGCNFMTDTAAAADIVRAVDHPAIRLQFDSGASAMNQESVGKVIGEFKDLIGHVHVSEPGLVPVGATSGLSASDHLGVAKALRESALNPCVTIEMLTRRVETRLDDIRHSLGFVCDTYRVAESPSRKNVQ